ASARLASALGAPGGTAGMRPSCHPAQRDARSAHGTIPRVTLAVDLVFIAQVLVLAGMLVWRRARVGVGLATWLGLLAVLAAQGYFLDFQSMPPRLTLAGLLSRVAGLAMLPAPA